MGKLSSFWVQAEELDPLLFNTLMHWVTRPLPSTVVPQKRNPQRLSAHGNTSTSPRKKISLQQSKKLLMEAPMLSSFSVLPLKLMHKLHLCCVNVGPWSRLDFLRGLLRSQLSLDILRFLGLI